MNEQKMNEQEIGNSNTERTSSPVSGVFDVLEMFAWAMFVVLILFTFFFRICRTDGRSMENTLSNGDMLLLYSLNYEPEQGDIVVFQLTEHTGALTEKRAYLLGAVARENDGNGNGDYENEDHGLGDLPHEDQRADDGVHARHDLHEVVGQRRVDGIHVVGNAADDIARRVRVEIIDGKGGQLFEKLLAHSVDDPLRKADHQNGEEIRHDGGGRVADDHSRDIHPYDIKLNAALCGDRVDGVTGITRSEQGKLVGEQGENDGTKEERPFLHDVTEKALQDSARRFSVELCFIPFVGVVFESGVSCKASIQRWHLPSEIR